MKQNFPKWVPKELIQNTETISAGFLNAFQYSELINTDDGKWISEQKYKEAWLSILLHPETEDLFKSFKQYDFYCNQHYIEAIKSNPSKVVSNIFMTIINSGLLVSNKDELYTKKEYEEWKLETSQTIKKLIRLVDGTSFDAQENINTMMLGLLVAENYKGGQQSYEALIKGLEERGQTPQLTCTTKFLKSKLKRLESFKPELNSRPKDKGFRQSYFVRQVSKKLLAFTGKKHNQITADLTRILFHLDVYTPQQVSRLTKNNT